MLSYIYFLHTHTLSLSAGVCILDFSPLRKRKIQALTFRFQMHKCNTICSHENRSLLYFLYGCFNIFLLYLEFWFFTIIPGKDFFFFHIYPAQESCFVKCLCNLENLQPLTPQRLPLSHSETPVSYVLNFFILSTVSPFFQSFHFNYFTFHSQKFHFV